MSGSYRVGALDRSPARLARASKAGHRRPGEGWKGTAPSGPVRLHARFENREDSAAGAACGV